MKTATKLWTELTDIEKREAISLRLGWEFRWSDVWERQTWHHQDGHIPIPQGPPDWPTNDGLAFAEVWPKILEMDDSAALVHGLYHSDDPAAVVTIVPGPGGSDLLLTASGETWADAICHAAYELLGAPK